MGKHKQSLDASDERIATGIHQAAAATIVATGSTRAELDLAEKILRHDPKHGAPREAERMVESFNRLLDAAIESCNDSAHCTTRAERRFRLSAALGAAGVVLIESAKLGEFVDAKLELDALKITASPCYTAEPGPMLDGLDADEEPESFGAELLADETIPIHALATALATAPAFDVDVHSSSSAYDGSLEAND